MKTAAAFAKGLLELEGDLTPIIVSLVRVERELLPGIVLCFVQDCFSMQHDYSVAVESRTQVQHAHDNLLAYS